VSVLPLAICWVSVSGKAAALDRDAAVNGPSPVPLEVPEARLVPVAVALMLKVNWSAACARAPVICVVSRIVAKRTANIAPCKPPPTSVVVSVVGVLEPTI
jgi:hypothetical protein